MTRWGKVWTGCALLCVAACSHGGQSGDDGRPVSGKSGKSSKPDAGGATQHDAGASEFTAPCCFSADDDSDVVCASNVDRDDDAGPAARALNAPYRCRGDEGAWSCTCDDDVRSSHAAGCVGALLETCGKVAEALDGRSGDPTTSCETTLSTRAGRCELDAHGDYACTCEGKSTPKISHASTCEAALWATCAGDCESGDGSCRPVVDAPIGTYTCDCPQNHGIARNVSATVCNFALVLGCNLIGEDTLGCNGYTGFCDREDHDFACTCLDGSEHHVAVEDDPQQRFEPCRRSLESVCGTEGIPANKVCTRNENAYEARCIQPPDDTAPFTCSCTYHGADGDVGLLVESTSGKTCEDELLAGCPQVEPLGAAERERACTYYGHCSTRYPGFDREACVENAPDGCVACTHVELERSATDKDGCPVQDPQCVSECNDLVPKADGVAACIGALEDVDKADAEGKCLCDMCWPAFGECVTDAGCLEMLDCVSKQGCVGTACSTDPVCGPIITRYSSTHSLGILLRLGNCSATQACAMLR